MFFDFFYKLSAFSYFCIKINILLSEIARLLLNLNLFGFCVPDNIL